MATVSTRTSSALSTSRLLASADDIRFWSPQNMPAFKPAATDGELAVSPGDEWDTLSLKAYGTRGYWYVLMIANGEVYAGSRPEAGTTIRVPDRDEMKSAMAMSR